MGYLRLLMVLALLPVISLADGENPVFTAEIDENGVQKVLVMAGGTDYEFYPKHIVVKVGVPVEFSVQKTSWMVPHSVVISEPDAGMEIKLDMPKKKPETILFTPTATGSYTFYCDKKFLWFKSHREKGMEGLIEVVD